MPEVIKTMIDKNMLTHRHVAILAQHFLNERGVRKLVSDDELDTKVGKLKGDQGDVHWEALDIGKDLGILQRQPVFARSGRGTEWKLCIAQAWVPRIKAYLAHYAKLRSVD